MHRQRQPCRLHVAERLSCGRARCQGQSATRCLSRAPTGTKWVPTSGACAESRALPGEDHLRGPLQNVNSWPHHNRATDLPRPGRASETQPPAACVTIHSLHAVAGSTTTWGIGSGCSSLRQSKILKSRPRAPTAARHTGLTAETAQPATSAGQPQEDAAVHPSMEHCCAVSHYCHHAAQPSALSILHGELLAM